MKNKNIALKLTVTGNYKDVIDEAYQFSIKYDIPIELNFKNQFIFYIDSNMTIAQIEEIKNQRIIITV